MAQQTNFPLLKAKTAGGTATPTGIEQTGDDPPDDPMNADPGPYPEPYKARLAQTRALMEQQPTSLFTPEQIGQRQYANDRDYKVGMLAMLGAGGNQGMEQLGGTLFKNALAQRQPQVTERGAYDPQTGQWTLNPDYQQEKHRLEYGHVEDLDAAARMHWAQTQQSAADRRAAASQSQAATRSLRFALAGLGPDGAPAQGAPNAAVDLVGTNKMDINTVTARMAPPARQAFINTVQAKYPDWNPSGYHARVKAQSDFLTGPQGNQIRQFSVASNHLDQLGTMIDALQTGDNQLWNAAKLKYQSLTGETAPTDYNALKMIVGKEVLKAVVPGGGAEGEREEIMQAFKDAQTHQQLHSIVNHVRGLMLAQRQGLVEQAAAAGITEDQLPKYSGGGTQGGGKQPVHVNY